MIKRVLSLALIIVIICGVLISCSESNVLSTLSGDSIKLAYFDSSYRKNPDPELLSRVSELDDFTFVESDRTLLEFKKSGVSRDEYKFYNFKSMTIVFTKSIDSFGNESVKIVNGQIIQFASDNKYYLYDENGTQKSNGADNYYNVADLIVMDEKAFRIKDGVIVEEFTYPKYSGKISDSIIAGETHYFIKTDSYIEVYDNHCQFLRRISLSDQYTGECQSWILKNDNILVQSINELTDDATEYSYFRNGKKYSVKSESINVDTGHSTERNLDYIITHVYDSRISVSGTKDVENYVLANKIINKTVAETDGMLYNMDSNCRIKGAIFEGCEFIEAVGNESGCYIAHYDSGVSCLLDNDGDVIGQISGIVGKNRYNIATENAVYDYELNKICDAGSNMSFRGNNSSLLFFENKETNECVAIKPDGSRITVADGKTTELVQIFTAGGIYVVYNKETGKYTVYSGTGALLLSGLDNKPPVISDGNNSRNLLSVNNGDTTENYSLCSPQ